MTVSKGFKNGYIITGKRFFNYFFYYEGHLQILLLLIFPSVIIISFDLTGNSVCQVATTRSRKIVSFSLEICNERFREVIASEIPSPYKNHLTYEINPRSAIT